MSKRRRAYAPEFRRQMVELVRSGRNAEELSREFEPTAQAIRNWVAQADRDEGRRADGLTTAAGFKTVAITHSPDKETLAEQLGADEVVKEGKSLAKLGGADVILGTSNSTDAMADAIQGLRPDGRFVLMGFEAKNLSVSPADLIMKRIRILGSQQNRRVQQAYERVEQGKARFRAVLTF
jgi:D-arabinose 1-dehydrogenase-like Zn-dependent alcohol dehydrogenase